MLLASSCIRAGTNCGRAVGHWNGVSTPAGRRWTAKRVESAGTAQSRPAVISIDVIPAWNVTKILYSAAEPPPNAFMQRQLTAVRTGGRGIGICAPRIDTAAGEARISDVNLDTALLPSAFSAEKASFAQRRPKVAPMADGGGTSGTSQNIHQRLLQRAALR
jgi:hypothetical protein